MSSSTEELDLLERVFLRVGSAESDEQLESTINKFLIPVLLKLSSPNEGVRKKVMELLVHINKRVKRQPTVQLPVEALLTQYRDPKASSFFINFSILYIKLGYPRLPAAKQEELAPVLLLATEGKPKIHQDSLLLLLASIIGNVKIPAASEEGKKLFKIHEKPELMKHFSSFMLDMLLLPYVYISSSSNEESSSSTQVIQAPPGMSENGFKRVTSGDTPMTAEKLEQTKLGIVKFLATGIFSPNEIICHLIIAAADTRFTVANLADTELKRISGSVDWSSVTVSSSLFHLYLGSPEIPAEKKNLIPPANRVTPANTRIRLKILPYLCRLEKDAIFFPASVQVIFNSLYDANTNAKLKLQALNFALAIVRKSDIQTMKKMGGILYTGLLKVVWNQEENEHLRVIGYTIIGQIVKRLPRIINKNLIELQAFFENLSCDNTEIRGAVRDSLLTMIDAFKLFMKEDQADPKSNAQFFMLALLSAQIESKESMARFVAVKYTAAAFDLNHAPSRYLLLLSTGDSNSDVSSVALQSVYSFFESEASKEKIMLPDFKEMCQLVYQKAMERMKNVNQRVIVHNQNLPFNEVTFNEILLYLRLCLAKSAGVDVRTKEPIIHPCESSPAIRNYIFQTHQGDETIFNNYLSLIEMLLTATSSLVPLNSLLEVVGTSPELFAFKYSDRLQWVKNFLNNTKENIRDTGSALLSIISVNTMNDEALSDLVRDMMKNIETKSVETQHGAILTLGCIIERRILKMLEENRSFQDVIENWDFLGVVVVELAKHLESPYSLLVSASCTALGQISKVLPLPLPNESEDGLSKKKLMYTFVEIINNPKTSGKGKEIAIRACGLMCLGEKFPYVKELIEEFISTGKQTKDIDIHFSLGESLVLCIEGISSSEKCDSWKKEKSKFVALPTPEENLNLLAWLIDELVELTPQPHPNTRQAICVFFLSIIKRLSYLSVVKEKLSSIQYVFMELLSENNELVQDISSKGLALVYENTTEENKKNLVSNLLDQLLSGKRTVPKVTGSTKIFEGQLGVSPVGGNLSTYKELCSLASDLNQPDLIYKFMHLANHNAVWNSKKGAAFGFQTIASQAEDQLNEYLPKIIPRLYRYQFDPTPRIQQSMSNIWHSIVKSPQKTLDKYFNEILDDLLVNLTSNQWRVRISCCLALADFFRGNRSLLVLYRIGLVVTGSFCVNSLAQKILRPHFIKLFKFVSAPDEDSFFVSCCLDISEQIQDAKPKLPELWKSLFRVMDDVHEGTRLAAQSTGKTLANLHVKHCDKDAGKINQEMLDISLSIFLSQVINPVNEVKNLCLHTLSQLVSSAGANLKPNLTTLIPSLLEASGELESVGLSYLSTQYGAQAQAQEVIDVVRANMAKSHYTTQTVAKCVQYVEVEMLDVLVSKIIEIMKSASFGSRISCAHVIILLAHHLGRSLEQYTGKFLSALLNGLLDRNSTVRKTYASAIGQIIHTAKPSSVEKLMIKLSNWYFEKEDANTRIAVGHTLQSVAQYNGELLRDQFPVVIPLIFFAMNEKKIEGEDNSRVIMWEEIWNDVTPGSEIGIRQHMNEICTVLQKALSSSSWTMKAQGGRCISTIATKISDTIESKHIDMLIDLSLTALQGKTFPGKEDLLKGLSKLASKCSESLKSKPEKCSEIVEAILRECGKSEPVYKRHSIEALGVVLEAFDNVDYFQRVYEIIQNLLKQLDENTEKGESSEELSKIRNEKFKTIEVMYETLGKSWPKKKETQLKYQEIILNECYTALETSPRDVQLAVLSAFWCYIEKLHYFNEEYESSSKEDVETLRIIIQKTTQALHYSLGIPKHTRLRKEALNIVYSLGNKLNTTGRKEEMKIFMDALKDRLQDLEKDTTPEIKTRLMDLKQMYKN